MEQQYITISLLADDGSEIQQECMVIGTFDVDRQDYVALAPTDDNQTVLIYALHVVDEDHFTLQDIEDETTYMRVVAEFNTIIDDE